MEEELLRESFAKAGGESGKDSLNGKAEFLAEVVLEKYRFQISARSLTRYYKKESVPPRKILDYLSSYLGYGSYEDFVSKRMSKTEKQRIFSFSKSSMIVGAAALPLLLLTLFFGYKSGEKKCLKWEQDRYLEVSCSGGNLEREFDEYLLENFRKIKITGTTRFFKNDEVQVWYDKSNNELEFFTAPGIHPENGKTLKPITKYMIEAHQLDKPTTEGNQAGKK